jgi:hypothetical protein
MTFALAAAGKNTRNAVANKKSVLPNWHLLTNSKCRAAPNQAY